MRRALPLIAFVLAACATSGPPDLSRDIDRILESQRGKTIAVAYYDLRDGTTFLRNERAVFHAASTMKVPVMFGIFEAVSRGELRLDQPVPVRNEFASIFDGSSYELSSKDDSDGEVYKFIGKEMPLEYLVRHMIVRSSNLATNNVIDLIGAKQVMSLMHRIGADDIKVLRGVEDQKAFDHGMNNTTTAYDLMLIFRALGEKKVISAEASQKMIDILSAQEFNRGIPAGLPRDTRVAHKTGDITRVAHDAALVLPDDGSGYVLVILTRGYPKTRDAEKIMARLSRAVWRARAHKPAGASSGSIDSLHRGRSGGSLRTTRRLGVCLTREGARPASLRPDERRHRPAIRSRPQRSAFRRPAAAHRIAERAGSGVLIA